MRPLAIAILLSAAFPAGAARKLVDEVVAVVDARSITLSELQAETRIRLIEAQGASVAFLPLDRKLLAASLRKTVEERVIIAEVERLKLFDLDRAEVEALVARVRVKFAKETEWEAFTRFIELTDDEIGQIVARELRVARYLDNRLKLAAQIRESELAPLESGKKLTAGEREALRQKLALEKYQRLLQDLLIDLRKRATVRVLDPLDPEPASASGGKPGKAG